jgi:hypothetical protein
MTEGGERVTFGHGDRHLVRIGLNQKEVEAAILRHLEENPIVAQGVLQVRKIVFEGVELEYRAMRLDALWINVGTYFETKK